MSKSYKRKYLHRGTIIRRRGNSFQVEINRAGERIRKTKKTLGEAEDYIDRKLKELDNLGTAALQLSDKQRVEAAEALRDLAGVPLKEAVRFYQRHHKAPGGVRTVKELLDEYLEAKKKANKRTDTVADIRSRVGRLAMDFGARPVHTLTSNELESWLDRHRYSGQTRINYLRVFGGFFNYARRQKLIENNPADRNCIDRPSLDDRIPEVYTPENVESLLHAAEEEAKKLVPMLAIGFFAGLRTAELEKLDWSDVDLQQQLITVRPEVSKKRRQRHVTMSDNLAAWLLSYQKSSGRICLTDSVPRKDRALILKKAKIAKWPHNVMRHSFASYHLVKHQDPSRTAMELGHMSQGIVFDHYRTLVKPQDAEKYWRIYPGQDSNATQPRTVTK